MAEIRLLLNEILSVLAAQTGSPMGDAAAPSGIVIPDDLPYSVVQSIGSVDRSAPMSQLLKDGDDVHEIQITNVGESREQAQGQSDAVREAFVAGNLSWSGRAIVLVELDAGNEIQRDDDVQPPLFYGIDSFLVYSTPA